ncbi:hypothetical protein DIPPA_07162 [Diplonema papillatum]|nr:hypothetical protein DIPPA_07162 [Diplonema papillatum]
MDRSCFVGTSFFLCVCLFVSSQALWKRLSDESGTVAVSPAAVDRTVLLTQPFEDISVTSSLKHLASLGVRIKPKGEWTVGICSGTKASGAWLREWVELQILAGVDHLWLVNDNDAETEDGTQAIMEFYERLGFLTIIPGRMPLTHPGCRPKPGCTLREENCAAPKYCAENVGDQVKYMIFADTDEFVYPHEGCSLSDFVSANCDPNRAAWYLTWERFGTSGYRQQPSGLMTENFVTSGGDCSSLTHRHYNKSVCRDPWSHCSECRHMKVMFNMQCATTDHVAFMHQLANTSTWKVTRYGKDWQNSPGPDTLPFKKKECRYIPHLNSQELCTDWLLGTANESADQSYSSDCCQAGIGYNHYGTKALTYYRRKQRRQKIDKRGWRAELATLDLNGFISHSILRYTRALRSRYVSLGLPTAVEVSFLDVRYEKNGKPANGTCFVDGGRQYVPKGFSNAFAASTLAVDPGLAKADPTTCCGACHEYPKCAAWSVSRGACQLLIPNRLAIVADDKRPKPIPRPLRKIIEARRVVDPAAVSGIVVHDECRKSQVRRPAPRLAGRAR